MTPGKIIEVVAGVLLRPDGSYLLGSRPQGKPYAGYWEFPGGKVEPGETFEQALARELAEEMGIRTGRIDYWLTREHVYEHASVRLRFYRVWDWQGELTPLEGQSFAWERPGHEDVGPMLPANGPILRALSLPFTALCADADASDARLLAALERDDAPRLVEVRASRQSPDRLAGFCRDVARRVHARGGRVLVHADPAGLAGLPVDGVVLDDALLDRLTARPDLPWVGARVRDVAGLARAGALGLDYAVLDVPQPGLVLAAAAPLPVYFAADDARGLDAALADGAHGLMLTGGAQP